MQSHMNHSVLLFSACSGDTYSGGIWSKMAAALYTRWHTVQRIPGATDGIKTDKRTLETH